MKILKLFYLLVFFATTNLFATGQAPDYLIIGLDTLKIHSNPLEKYFEKNPIPENLITMSSTGNWRGYIAYFKFIDNKLVVENIYKEEYKDINGTSKYIRTSIYKEVFGSSPNFDCNFYSGLLICPSGELLEYVHMGYSSIYEKYKLFEINLGNRVKSKDFTGEEFQNFKINYFKYYKKTEEYKVKAQEFKKMMIESQTAVDATVEIVEGESKTNVKKKRNKYLEQKEAAFNADKQLDSFMFLFLNDYIKTIEIPKT